MTCIAILLELSVNPLQNLSNFPELSINAHTISIPKSLQLMHWHTFKQDTVNPRFKPRGLINVMVHNHPVQIETYILNLFNLDGQVDQAVFEEIR